MYSFLIIYDTTTAILSPDSVSFISWGIHKIKFLYGIDYIADWRALTIESSLASYLQMFMIGDNNKRVFLHLYLNA